MNKKEYFLINENRLDISAVNTLAENNAYWVTQDLLGLKKRDKLGAIKLAKNGRILGPLTVPGKPNDLVVFTVDFTSEEVFRLYQVGEYHKPIVFSLFDGRPHNLPFRGERWKNWHNRVLVRVE